MPRNRSVDRRFEMIAKHGSPGKYRFKGYFSCMHVQEKKPVYMEWTIYIKSRKNERTERGEELEVEGRGGSKHSKNFCLVFVVDCRCHCRCRLHQPT